MMGSSLPEPLLVDTHAHLGDAAFDADRAEVLARARAAGVSRVVCVAEDLEGSRRTLVLARRHQALAAAVGLHPDRVTHASADELLAETERIVALARRERESLVAVGEVGLDYWRAKTSEQRALQAQLFKRFVALAQELDLPLSVHSRSAGRQCLALLIDAGARRVVMHAFDGRAARARPGLEAGYFFSMPVSLLRSRQKQKLLRQIPLDRLLLESDAPVLGPEPGERNEPANLPLAVAEIARITGRDPAEIARVTSANARRCFAWGAPAAPLTSPTPPATGDAPVGSPGERA